MVTTTGQGAMPHHRPNRRRDRPGSRTRRNLSRKGIQSNLDEDYQEAILLARDASVILPYDKPNPSPLLRENFDQSWQRWQLKKAKQAEELALAEIKRLRLEQDLFGGDGSNDDEVFRLGALYKNVDNTQDEFNSVAPDLPSEHLNPAFVIRPGKPRRKGRSKRPTLPLYLSFLDFSTDADVTRILYPDTQIQHHDLTFPADFIPQSLPPSWDSESLHVLDAHCDAEDWTFIETARHMPQVTSPSSEPETWILLGDDS